MYNVIKMNICCQIGTRKWGNILKEEFKYPVILVKIFSFHARNSNLLPIGIFGLFY